MQPRVSIITPSYQQGEFIEDTLKSVLEQDVSGLEQWVIDAGSNDGTLALLRTYEERFPGRLKWTSEPDDGQSDAINKGFRRASGEFVAWLNADDVYYPGVIHRVVELFDQHPEVDVIYGKGTFLKRDGTFLTEFPHNQPFNAEALLNGWAFILQPTVFWRKRVFEKVGYLDNHLHYGMDFDLWCRMAVAGLNFYYDADGFYAAARFYRETKTASGQWKRSREMKAIAGKHSGRPLPAITLFAWLEALMATRLASFFYRPYKRITSGLNIDYWEIPAPRTSGSFPIHFPWYRAISEIEVDVLVRGRRHRRGGTLAAFKQGDVLAETPLTGARTRLRIPWSDTGASVELTLRIVPSTVVYRVVDVRVR